MENSLKNVNLMVNLHVIDEREKLKSNTFVNKNENYEGIRTHKKRQ